MYHNEFVILHCSIAQYCSQNRLLPVADFFLNMRYNNAILIVDWEGDNMGKPTDDNYRKLQSADTYDSADLDNMIDREFSITLDKMMRDKGVTTTDLVKSTSLSKAYINRLRDPSRKNDKPKREVVIDIALGINAALDEANLLLKRARYQELYTRDKVESVIIWGMLKKLSGAEIRELLAEKGLLDTIFPKKKEK